MSSPARLLAHADRIRALDGRQTCPTRTDLAALDISPPLFTAYADCVDQVDPGGDEDHLRLSLVHDLHRLITTILDRLDPATLTRALRLRVHRAPADTTPERIAALTVHDAIGWCCAAMARQSTASLLDLITEYQALPGSWAHWAGGFTPHEVATVPVADAVAHAALQGWTMPPPHPDAAR